MPKRIQRRRQRGWRMPENAVYVGRPTRWGNPFQPYSTVVMAAAELGIVRTDAPIQIVPGGVEECLAWYRIWIGEWIRRTANEHYLFLLRGRDLACWCPLDQPCHADILLDLANR